MANTINLRDGEQARLEITKDQEKAISDLYKSVYKDLKKQMDALPLKGEGTVSQSLKKTYLNKLTKQLKEAYKTTGAAVEDQIKQSMEDAAQAVVSSNNNWLEKVGLKVEGAYSYVPKDIVSMLSTGKLYGEDWSLSKTIWGDTQKKLDDINKIVAAGVAANKSAYDIAKDLEQYVNPSAKKKWDWSKVYPGTSKKVDYNAQRLARTMVSHAYQQSLLATTKYNPFVKGYKWRSAHTHRTCELCNERDGQVYSANDLPLDHPNGLCTFLVELEGSLEDAANRLGDWANGAEDPGLDKWYSSFYSVSSPSKNKSSSHGDKPTGVPPTKKWVDQIKGQSTEKLLEGEKGGLAALNEKQISAIKQYSESEYYYMNRYLRDKDGGKLSKRELTDKYGSDTIELVSLVQGGLGQTHLSEDLVLRRGSGWQELAGMLPGDLEDNLKRVSSLSAEELNSLLSGEVVKYSGFLSTSSGWDKGSIDLVETIFYTPAGTSGSSIMSISEYGTSEGEVLLNAGTVARISKIEESDGHMGSKIRVYAEIIP